MPRSLFCLCLFLAPCALAATSVPTRIVSMNVCTDQLLLLLVERERIASLSYLSADPAWSMHDTLAAGIPLNRGQAEEVLALSPDLVLTSTFSASFTARVLERLGQRVARFGFANDFDDIAAQVTELGELTGTQANAARLNDEIRTSAMGSAARLRPLLEGQRALFLSNNGFVYGAGTLQDAFLRDLGLVNVAAERGLTGPAPMSLEAVLAARPSLVFTPAATGTDAQLAHPLLRHPVWQRLGGQVRGIVLEDRWFDCAGPQVLRAYEALERELLP